VGYITGVLIIPYLYTFSYAGCVTTTGTHEWNKQVNSIYGNVSLGFRDMLYLDMSVRKDWSSALPSTKNGYAYPSIGASFIFTELMDNSVISFGKIRGGWAQVGNDVDALKINPIYNTAAQAYGGTNVIMYTPTEAVDPSIKPSTNTSIEAGFDTMYLNNRVGLSLTY
jgi:outer membrane receptor protein involved in Fe transport